MLGKIITGVMAVAARANGGATSKARAGAATTGVVGGFAFQPLMIQIMEAFQGGAAEAAVPLIHDLGFNLTAWALGALVGWIGGYIGTYQAEANNAKG